MILTIMNVYSKILYVVYENNGLHTIFVALKY